MALPVITDVIRASIEGLNADGTHWANVQHFRKVGATTFPVAIAALDPKLFAALTTPLGGGTPWASHAVNTASLQRIRYTPLDGASATTVINHVSAGLSNPATNNPMSNQVALVTTTYTNNRGRSFRGRLYESCRGEPENDATGHPLAAVVLGQNTQWDQFRISLGGTGVSWVVASYHLAVATDVISVNTNSRWDTQRRRLGR